MGRWALAALVVAGLLAVPPGGVAAQGSDGTLLFVRDGAVVAADPVTGRSHVVTAAGQWSHPTMADDGTILAVRDDEELVRMRQDGTILSAFRPAVVFDFGITTAVISADGQHAAYGTVETCNSHTGVCSSAVIVPADGSQTHPVGMGTGTSPYGWLPGGEVVHGAVHTFGVGDEDSTFWFTSPMAITALSVHGTLMAVTGNHGGQLGHGIGFFRLTGAPPEEPQLLDCAITHNDPQRRLHGTIGWSPSGTALVVEEQPAEGVQGPAAAVVLTDLDVDAQPCTFNAVVIEDAQHPSWGVAAYEPPGTPPDPEPTDPEPTDPEPTDPSTSPPPGVTRIGGDGPADPIAQAVAVSQRLFADGQAARVVLATADRFPDALAGAALAGADGPILFTPSAGALDPRVRAEIARVTGGAGIVLVLGGPAAVNEAAAADARAAGGDTPCPTPLPASCRYAGSGREETAALIADTVVAEHPESAGRAMVARGDQFADAITGGAFAARMGIPILLTPTDLAHPFTVEWLDRHDTQHLTVLGSSFAVSEATAAALPAVEQLRVAGPERTATSAAIATELWQAAGIGTGATAVVNVRAADGWQTALAAAVASARWDMPQLGVEPPPAILTPQVRAYLQTVPADRPVVAFGGTALVSDAQLEEAARARS